MPAPRLGFTIASLLYLPLLAAAGPSSVVEFDVGNPWGTRSGLVAFQAQAGVAYRIDASGLLDAAAGAGGGYLVDADGVLQADAGEVAAEYFKLHAAPHAQPRAGETRQPAGGLAHGALVASWDYAPNDFFLVGRQSTVSTSIDGARLLLAVATQSPFGTSGAFHVAVTPLGATTGVAEPATAALAALGLALAGTRRRRPGADDPAA